MPSPLSSFGLQRWLGAWVAELSAATLKADASAALHELSGGEAEQVAFATRLALATQLAQAHPQRIVGIRGIGLMQGLEFHDGEDVSTLINECFRQQLVVECCGPRGQVLKLMPALTIEPAVLRQGLEIIADACQRLFGHAAHAAADADARAGAELAVAP